VTGRRAAIICYDGGQRRITRRRDGAWMLHATLRTVFKIAVAPLVVGTILAHFGITVD
jgi:hypothetical protein